MSNLALGAVQFGTPYGVSNNEGKTPKNQALSILNFAQKKGISMIDTAPSYGDSERVLGELFDGEEWEIITKTISFNSKEINEEQIGQLRRAFQKSLANLNQKSIYGLLIHSCNDLLKPRGEAIFKEIEKFRNSGLVQKIGVSVYDSDQIDYLLSEYDIDIVQLPINILDQRLINSGHLKKLKDCNIEIHARSVFLQGLLLMSLEDIPSYFSPILDDLIKIKKASSGMGLSSLELALSFVTGVKEVDKVIIGVNEVKQLMEIINASQIYLNPKDFDSLSIYDSNFLNPSNWKL
jgi:aryl-alcohol dehydrogenase-like predicted oxidoreductase